MIQFIQAIKEAKVTCDKSYRSCRHSDFMCAVSSEMMLLEDRLKSTPGAVVTICDGMPIAVMQEAHGLQIFINSRREPAVIIDVFEGVVKVCSFSSDADEAKVVMELDSDGIIENVELP